MLTTCSRCTNSTLESSCSSTVCSSTTPKTGRSGSLQLLDDLIECSHECDGVTIMCNRYCTINSSVSKVEEDIRRYTFVTMNNLELSIITFGARIISLKVPGNIKGPEDVILGFSTLEDYAKNEDYNIGGLVAKLKRTELDFSEINFESYVSSTCQLVLSCVLREEPEVCPCDLFLQIKYTVCKNNTITIDYLARVARPVLFNIGHMLYMNLNGFNSEKEDIKHHVIFINADKFYDEDSKIMESVDDTIYDLRIPVNFETILDTDNDFQQCYMVNKDPNEELTFVSRIIEPDSGRAFEIYTNQPSVFFKSTLYLPPCKATEESEENETEEVPIAYEARDCEDCEEVVPPTIIKHSNFPHCFLKHKAVISPDDDVVTRRGKGKKTADSCTINSASTAELSSESSICDYENSGFYFKSFGMPPKGSILKPGDEYHHTVLYKFGYYCPLEQPEDDSCCSEASTTDSNTNK